MATAELTGYELLDVIDAAVESIGEDGYVDAFMMEDLVEGAELLKEVIA